MPTKNQSQQLRAGGKTYFFDIETTQEQKKPYLKITESRYKGDDGGSPTYDKRSVFVFAEHAEEFARVASQMAKNLVAEERSAASD
jgi:hypothetical protein